MPSNPKPEQQRVRGGDRVADGEAGGVGGFPKLLAFGPLPAGGPVIAQPPRVGALERRDVPSGKVDVVEEHAEALGGPVAGVGDRDLDRAARRRRDRSMLHCCQPPELPLAAFQAPVVPVGVQRRVRVPGLVVVELRVQGDASRRCSRQLSPVRLVVVWPLASGQRRPVVAARACAPRRTGGPSPPRCRTTSRRTATRRRPARRSPGSAACRRRRRSASTRTGRRCAGRTGRRACPTAPTASSRTA